MDEIVSLSASRLAELIRKRAISPVEVAEAYLGRIETLNPSLNAIVTLAPDVIEQAQAAEARLSSAENVGPLHGVPLTIKDTKILIALKFINQFASEHQLVRQIQQYCIYNRKGKFIIQ